MTFYVDQGHKNNALRGLLDYLELNSQGALPGGKEYDKLAGKQLAYNDAAERLHAILDRPVGDPAPDPVEPFPPLRMQFEAEDMCVVVVAPAGTMGVDRTLTFDRNTADFMRGGDLHNANVDRWTKLVAAALLQDALNQLGA